MQHRMINNECIICGKYEGDCDPKLANGTDRVRAAVVSTLYDYGYQCHDNWIGITNSLAEVVADLLKLSKEPMFVTQLDDAIIVGGSDLLNMFHNSPGVIHAVNIAYNPTPVQILQMILESLRGVCWHDTRTIDGTAREITKRIANGIPSPRH